MAWSSRMRGAGTAGPGTEENTWARGINVALGIWLFISAFLWLHTSAQFTNTWLVGLAIAVVAAVGFAVPQARWVNTALAAWLIISVWALPTLAAATFWNNLLVGIASLIVSVMPIATEYGGRTTRGFAGRERHA
jgi:hypothetical protein